MLCYKGRERARLGQNVCEPVSRRGIVKEVVVKDMPEYKEIRKRDDGEVERNE